MVGNQERVAVVKRELRNSARFFCGVIVVPGKTQQSEGFYNS
jgi:hypothetical protein